MNKETTATSTLSLHDALPICRRPAAIRAQVHDQRVHVGELLHFPRRNVTADVRIGEEVELEVAHVVCHHLDRKSTRLNSSHGYISYAVFCLKKNRTLITTTAI